MTTTTTMTDTFSGDWEYDGILEAYETAFTAVRFGDDWNGFCRPIVAPNVMEAFVARQQMLIAAGETLDAMRWDGNGVRVQPGDEDEAVDGDTEEVVWLLPDADGNFDLGALGYTFSRLDSDDNVVRTVR